MGIGRGDRRGLGVPLEFEIISKKRLFFQFRGVETKFHHFCPPRKKFWENPLLATPWKKSLQRPLSLALLSSLGGDSNMHVSVFE